MTWILISLVVLVLILDWYLLGSMIGKPLFTLAVVVVFGFMLAACVSDGHEAGGFADGYARSQSINRPLVIYRPVPYYIPDRPERLRYYGQPRRDRWDAGDDPYLQENDPWLARP